MPVHKTLVADFEAFEAFVRLYWGLVDAAPPRSLSWEDVRLTLSTRDRLGYIAIIAYFKSRGPGKWSMETTLNHLKADVDD